MRYAIISLITFTLFASMILNINVKEHKNRVDLLLNFDTPFHGKILQKQEKDKTELILKGVTILAPWQKKLNTSFVYQIEITPMKKDSKITIYSIEKVRINAAKSKDGYSLKIRITPPKSALSQKKRQLPGFNAEAVKKYLLWAAVAIAAIIASLFLIRLFGKTKEPVESKRVIIPNTKTEEFQIKFEKPLDERNKIALISFNGVNYLVIIGSSNILLGKYKEGEIETAEEFEKAIQSQNISTLNKKEEEEIFTTIEEYKKRASGEI